MILLDEKKYSSKAINELIEKLTTINWYKAVGQKDASAEQALSDLLNTLEVDQYKIEWVNKSDLDETLNKVKLSGSTVWEKLKDLPDQLKEVIEKQDELKLLKSVVDLVPEVVYHRAFECAYDTFKEEGLVQFFVGQAMYFSVLICVAELANQSAFSQKFITLLESGHVPVGPDGNTVYIV